MAHPCVICEVGVEGGLSDVYEEPEMDQKLEEKGEGDTEEMEF